MASYVKESFATTISHCHHFLLFCGHFNRILWEYFRGSPCVALFPSTDPASPVFAAPGTSKPARRPTASPLATGKARGPPPRSPRRRKSSRGPSEPSWRWTVSERSSSPPFPPPPPPRLPCRPACRSHQTKLKAAAVSDCPPPLPTPFQC